MNQRDYTYPQHSLIVLSDATMRCRDVAAMVGTHMLIADSDEPEARGLSQVMTRLRDDLTTIGNDLAALACEARSNGPMATMRARP